MSEEDVFDDEAYERNERIISAMFPRVKFSVCIDLEELDEVLSNEAQIVIKCSHNCYCYDRCPRPNDYIVVRGNGRPITVKDAIKRMEEEGYDSDCNHQFLEGFWKRKPDSIEFEAWFGS